MESVLRPGVCAASMQMDYDDEVAHRAVHKLRDLARDGREELFFLSVSFTHPHDPWELRPGYWERYEEAAIDLPAVGAIPRAEADPHSLRLRDMAGIDAVEVTDAQLRTARHAYYAAISYVGEVLGALAESGMRDETIVPFTADHGELFGERGLWYKIAFFEPAARVPLIVSAPGRLAARRAPEPVSLLDIAPTLLDLCGLESSDDLNGAGNSSTSGARTTPSSSTTWNRIHTSWPTSPANKRRSARSHAATSAAAGTCPSCTPRSSAARRNAGW